jgi:hypothetical protein
MRLALAAAGLSLAAIALPAATAAQRPDPRVNQLIVYGDDSCPPSTDEEIIVCAKLPEDDRFRIPPNLRADPNDPANLAWTQRAEELRFVGRTGIGSCSPVGPGGFTGCFDQIVRQARAERAGEESVNWNQLIEEARQERLGRIDAEAAAAEAEAQRATPR